MCRLLGAASLTPTSLVDLAGGAVDALQELSHVHADGWGMAWIGADGTLSSHREARPAHRSSLFQQLCRVPVRAAVLHLRKASPGLAATTQNTHPFVAADLAFIHNGFVGPAAELAGLPGGSYPLQGDTDSERYFAAVRAVVAGGVPLAEAVSQVGQAVTTLSATSGANVMVLGRQTLVAGCFHVPDRADPDWGEDYLRLYYRIDEAAQTLLVASSGVPQGNWTELRNGCALSTPLARPAAACCPGGALPAGQRLD